MLRDESHTCDYAQPVKSDVASFALPTFNQQIDRVTHSVSFGFHWYNSSFGFRCQFRTSLKIPAYTNEGGTILRGMTPANRERPKFASAYLTKLLPILRILALC